MDQKFINNIQNHLTYVKKEHYQTFLSSKNLIIDKVKKFWNDFSLEISDNGIITEEIKNQTYNL